MVTVNFFYETPRVLTAGIGGRILQDNTTIIERIIPGFAAERGGRFQIGDAVQAVNGVQVQGMSLDAIKNLTIGPEGSSVQIEAWRNGQPFAVTLQRQCPSSSMSLGEAGVLVR
jgi:C-terminal processing protease CtpA/Prc